jgi:hypothetical protein
VQVIKNLQVGSKVFKSRDADRQNLDKQLTKMRHCTELQNVAQCASEFVPT